MIFMEDWFFAIKAEIGTGQILDRPGIKSFRESSSLFAARAQQIEHDDEHDLP